MKYLMVAIMFLGLSAQADIPMPDRGQYHSVHLEAEESKALFEALDAEVQEGNSLRGYSNTYKVFRTEDGLFEAVCYRTEYRRGNRDDRYNCSMKISKDGNPVPRHRHIFRRG